MNEKKQTSLSERIARLREGGLTSAVDVGKTIREAQQVTASPEDVRVFFEAVAKGRRILAFDFSQNMPQAKARDFVANLSWEDCLLKIRDMAGKGSTIAQEVVVVHETFASNPLLYNQLLEVLNVFERPCQDIRTKEEIISFLEELTEKGLAEKTKEHPKRKAIHWDAWYAPKRGIALARLGWLFVAQATVRVQRRTDTDRKILERLQSLLEQATISSEPEGQGLTRILDDEFGAVTIWSSHFWHGGKNQGFFAVTLERNNRGFRLKDVIADFPFPKKMEECQLLTISPDGVFGELPFMKKENYQAIRQLERLVQSRLKEENRLMAQIEKEVEPATE